MGTRRPLELHCQALPVHWVSMSEIWSLSFRPQLCGTHAPLWSWNNRRAPGLHARPGLQIQSPGGRKVWLFTLDPTRTPALFPSYTAWTSQTRTSSTIGTGRPLPWIPQRIVQNGIFISPLHKRKHLAQCP